MNCETCDIVLHEKKDGILDKQYLIHLKDGWVLSHWNESATRYLGYLVLSSQYHRKDFSELCEQEFKALGFYLQWIEKKLKQYWENSFPYDQIEQIYFVYLNETPFIDVTLGKLFKEDVSWKLHIHFHILPRTPKMRAICNAEMLGWDLLKTVKLFPSEYLCDRENYSKKRLINYLKKEAIKDSLVDEEWKTRIRDSSCHK